MNNNKTAAMSEHTSQAAEIEILLQQILSELDVLELTVPAIKVAEAIDHLRQYDPKL